MGMQTNCAGYVGDPFENVTRSCDEPHERDAVLFHARPHDHLQRFAEVPSSQAHVATPSAIRKRVSHLLGFLILAAVAGEEEGCFSELVPLQPEGLGACETAFPTAQGRGSKLVTEDWKPVGSGLTIRNLPYERNTAGFLCFPRIDLWWLFSERMFQVASSGGKRAARAVPRQPPILLGISLSKSASMLALSVPCFSIYLTNSWRKDFQHD